MPFVFKLILFGDGGVGKTSLIERYVQGIFNEDTRITVGVAFMVKRIILNGEMINLQIWDFGGEERFRFLLPSYCQGAHGGIFMYDITAPHTLHHLTDWLRVFKEKGGDVPILAVGTKADLETQRKVRLEEAKVVAAEQKIQEVMEVSAKTAQNVPLLFEKVSTMMIEDVLRKSPNPVTTQSAGRLGANPNEKRVVHAPTYRGKNPLVEDLKKNNFK